MFEIYYEHHEASFNWVGLIAATVSGLSILATLYYIFVTKRTEILKLKFEKFCISPLDEIFKKIDDLFSTDATVDNSIKQKITDHFVDIQLLLITLQSIYPSITIQDKIHLIEEFTDKVYNLDESSNLSSIRAKYFDIKIKLYNNFFEFAMTKELVLIKKHFRFFKWR